MDVRARKLLDRQDAVVAWRQLRGAGVSADVATRLVRGWRKLHDGVWFAGFGTPTDMQRWLGATLTTPESVLADECAAAFWKLRRDRGNTLTVVRPGAGGKQRMGRLVVRYSRTLAGEIVVRRGIRVTTPERTIIDVWPRLADFGRRKLLREALRTRVTTCARMTAALARHRGRRGTQTLGRLIAQYTRLQLERCKSDGEAYAMEVLDDAGLELPRVNEEVAGEEADLSWRRLGLIIELDGPQFHVLRDADARKTATWTQAGNRVLRMSTDTLFATPEALVELALSAGVPQIRRRRRAKSREQRSTRLNAS
jgi:very-short-patch-repair endonuclease